MYRIDVEMFLDEMSRENDFDVFFDEEIDLSCLEKLDTRDENITAKKVDIGYQEHARA